MFILSNLEVRFPDGYFFLVATAKVPLSKVLTPRKCSSVQQCETVAVQVCPLVSV